MKPYDHKKIEKKWQKKWQADGLYETKDSSKKPKFYCLDMFPYPSGEGLHVGHPKGYIATDIYSRYMRMRGYNVLHPMGWDAFGLPAENYAIKHKVHPRISTNKNIKHYKEQLQMLGLSYDWKREIDTTDPEYYKWTQWIFLQLFKQGLAYESYEPINWCPSCQTGLANEDLEDGKCERCGSEIEKKLMRQWVLRITDYADRLLFDLDESHYERPRLIDTINPHVSDKPVVSRHVAHAIVFDPAEEKYLIIRNKKHGWDTVIIGGIEDGEDAVTTAKREVQEETGYIDLEFKRLLGGETEAHYYAKHKGENRIAFAQGVLFELKSKKRVPIADGEDQDDEILWVDEADFVPGKMVNAELPLWLERLKDPKKGWPKPLIEWPQSIKEMQRNWIGRSEGALIKFEIRNLKFETNSKSKNLNEVEVFTTRPDTIFGATFIAISPELADKWLHLGWSADKDVEKYIRKTLKDRAKQTFKDTPEKTGIDSGLKAVNPASSEEIPVWITNYVLGDVGTGAIMAVPAHDERDYEFAKKYELPIKQVVMPLFDQLTDADAIRPEEPYVFRQAVTCLIKHHTNDNFLCLKMKKTPWLGFVMGGIEAGEDPVTSAIREIQEETGYKNIKFIKKIYPTIRARFYHQTKKQNRDGEFQTYYFELIDDARGEIAEEENELHEVVWVPRAEVGKFVNRAGTLYMWEAFLRGGDESPFTNLGMIVDSGKYSGKKSIDIMKEITDAVGGTWIATYKLKDWVFSRQRYWGEPIPIIHCDKCGAVPVLEKDLPVKLPEVKSYAPTGTGESPLADIKKWVNTKCPTCKGPGKRETNTMPQWAGSSWYYLRYMDPHNKKKLVDAKKEKYWAPVDLYVGGTEHATRHLIYARFWHKFLYDIGVVSTKEPFKRFGKSLGLVLGEDGRKMSKRWGNVVNPDEVVDKYGADTMRLYEMFMGPFDQEIAWNTQSMIGTRRFIERVWRLSDKIGKETKPSLGQTLHRTIKKVGEDIQGFDFNTAISAMMILMNEAEKCENLAKEDFSAIVRILAPFAPHAAEELWQIHKLGRGSVHEAAWPEYDLAKLESDTVTIVIQVNGKVREQIKVDNSVTEEEIVRMAKQKGRVAPHLEGKNIKKVVFIPKRLVNFVT